MQFEESERPGIMGPLIVEDALSDVPIFGPDKADLESAIESALESHIPVAEMICNKEARTEPLPPSFATASTVAEKLISLRGYARSVAASKEGGKNEASVSDSNGSLKAETTVSKTPEAPQSCRGLHEALLTLLPTTKGLPAEAQGVMDHVMLLRAKEKYLFDPSLNKDVVDDDPWLRFLWRWIRGELHFCPSLVNLY